ncbi:MAG TPA: hypothetical protein VIJ22_15525 [Polyangiaceae bacterium]
MPRPSFLLLAGAALVACGSRTGLDDYGGGVPEAGGALTDAPVGTSGPTCASWTTTNAPVQVSNIASIIGVQSAIATPAGVLVGYADDQFPPVDTSWHGRLVAFGDGSLGPDQTVLTHDALGLGWTRITFAEGFGHSGAAASDQADGLLFTTTDATGATTGSVAHNAGDSAQDLFATPSGYTILRSPFDSSGATPGPVSLATLDPSGSVSGSVQLLDATTPVVSYSRIAFPDGSFALVWLGNDACPSCLTVHAQHLASDGEALAPAVALHAFGPDSPDEYAVSASSKGLLFAWAEGGTTGPVTLSASPFDADGQPVGAPSVFAEAPNQSNVALALTAAPGGDVVASWIAGGDVSGQLYVEAVAPDGTAEGPATTLAPVSFSPEADLFVVASPLGAMVLYESDVPNYGIEVYAIPLKCAAQ